MENTLNMNLQMKHFVLKIVINVTAVLCLTKYIEQEFEMLR